MAIALAAVVAFAGPALADELAAPDNTGRNALDGKEALNPMHQSEDKGDLTITQQIRQRIVGDDTMSLDAKNVKVITIAGIVTLRGPVEGADERATIVAIAEGTPGVRKVDDQLEVETD
jgi:osmotically-inducible protein OsmY